MSQQRKSILLIIACLLVNVYCLGQDKTDTLSSYRSYSKKLLKGQKHYYTVRLSKDEFFETAIIQKGVDLTVDVYDPLNKLILSIDSPNGNEGPEPVSFKCEADGTYLLEISQTKDPMLKTDSAQAVWLELNQGEYEISPVSVLSAESYKRLLEENNKKQQNIISALRNNANELQSVDAGNSFNDLEFLKKVLENVKIVGLGEATHGTSEFFRMKSRILEFLVKEMGFTVFLIEGSYAGCNNINDYVLEGKGSSYASLTSQGFWTWDTKEVIDMIEWIREYNKTVPPEKKVKFLGIDIQNNGLGGGFDIIQNYLFKVDPVRAESNKGLFEILKKMDKLQTEGIDTDSFKKEYLSLIGFMLMSKGHYVQRSSEKEYETIMQYALTVAQYFDAYFMNESDKRKNEREWRDYYMASNFFSVVRNEAPGTKFVLWAHNGHVSRNSSANVNGGFKPLGSYISEAFGNEYYSFGFSFSKGSFQAIEIDQNGKRKGLQEFTTEHATENSLDWYFEQTGYSKFIIDFRSKDQPEAINEFISTGLISRSYGANANREYFNNYYENLVIKNTYDGMIFINNTTRAKPTETGNRY